MRSRVRAPGTPRGEGHPAQGFHRRDPPDAPRRRRRSEADRRRGGCRASSADRRRMRSRRSTASPSRRLRWTPSRRRPAPSVAPARHFAGRVDARRGLVAKALVGSVTLARRRAKLGGVERAGAGRRSGRRRPRSRPTGGPAPGTSRVDPATEAWVIDRRQLDERLDPAERFGQGEERVASHDRDRPSACASRPWRPPASGTNETMPPPARIWRTPRRPADGRAARRPARVAHAVDVVAPARKAATAARSRRGARPGGQRAQAAQDQEAVERAGDRRPSRSAGIAAAPRARRPLVTATPERPCPSGPPRYFVAEWNTMSAPSVERALQGRRGERVVDDEQGAPLARGRPSWATAAAALDVDELQERVRRRLEPDQRRPRRSSASHSASGSPARST